MKDRRKMHLDKYPGYAPGHAPKMTLVFFILFLVIGALFFFRHYFHQSNPAPMFYEPVEIRQEGSTPTQESSEPTTQ